MGTLGKLLSDAELGFAALDDKLAGAVGLKTHFAADAYARVAAADPGDSGSKVIEDLSATGAPGDVVYQAADSTARDAEDAGILDQAAAETKQQLEEKTKEALQAAKDKGAQAWEWLTTWGPRIGLGVGIAAGLLGAAYVWRAFK